MTAVAEAIRQELLTLLAEPLDGRTAARIGRIAQQAAKLLGQGAAAAVADVLADPQTAAGPSDAADTVETGGVRAVREMLAAAPELLARYENAPDRLTSAIREARQYGMTDVAAELEKRLTGGRALDSTRYAPPEPAFVTQFGIPRAVQNDDGDT